MSWAPALPPGPRSRRVRSVSAWSCPSTIRAKLPCAGGRPPIDPTDARRPPLTGSPWAAIRSGRPPVSHSIPSRRRWLLDARALPCRVTAAESYPLTFPTGSGQQIISFADEIAAVMNGGGLLRERLARLNSEERRFLREASASPSSLEPVMRQPFGNSLALTTLMAVVGLGLAGPAPAEPREIPVGGELAFRDGESVAAVDGVLYLDSSYILNRQIVWPST